VKENQQLDVVDRRIVRELQRDASLSHAALAEKVGASAASVWRRVRNLEKAGVLGKAVRLANPESLDRSVNVLCQVRMTRQTVETRAEFEEFIQSRGEIVECYAMSGEWDYLLRIAVRDVADYDRFIMRGVLAHQCGEQLRASAGEIYDGDPGLMTRRRRAAKVTWICCRD
jgi:Lrp/AsnC family transcriptional regulator